MNNSITDYFLKTFESVELPESISSRFEAVLRLDSKNDLSCETYLLSEKQSQQLYVLKCYSKKEDFKYFANESKILGTLSHKSIPKILPELDIETDNCLYTVREYTKGMALNNYLDEYSIDEAGAVGIIIQLCDILSYLHNQDKPVIHRDIKPSNIIIDPQTYEISLIDFGISRRYNENTDMDTICFGTRNFAPPEQYGFMQTDCRTDIYALGILLRFMLTGSVEKEKTIKNKTLENIASRCSQIDRDKRYSTAATLKKALLGYKLKAKKKIALAAALLLLIPSLAFAYSILNKPAEVIILTENEVLIAFATQNENNRAIFENLGWDIYNPETWTRIERRRWDNKISKIYFHYLGLEGTLDLTGFSGLTALHIDSNNLTSLILKGCTNLDFLDCGGNNLSELDISDLVNLQKFWCWGNQLTKLDVSKNMALEYFNCNANYLTYVDLSNNTKLTFLDIWKNLFEKVPALENAPNLFYAGLRENYIDLENDEVKASLAKIEAIINTNKLVLPPDWKEQATTSPESWEPLFNHWYNPQHNEHWWDWNSVTGGLTAEPQIRK